MNDDIIIIERFSKKRYETYKAKGIPFHVVCGKGRLCEVKAFDCGDNHDQVFVESTYDSWSPKSVFEQAYKCADSFLDRLQIEFSELAERLDSLDEFLSRGFDHVKGWLQTGSHAYLSTHGYESILWCA